MLAKQLPPGVRVLSLKETPDKGMAALDLAPDLRIFRAEFRIMRPYSVQAMVRGEWRDLAFSAGRGRHGNTGFPALQAALRHAGIVYRHVYGQDVTQGQTQDS
jgi:hypothetical protein